MAWTGNHDIIKDIDLLSYMTNETPLDKISCAFSLPHETETETLSEVAIPQPRSIPNLYTGRGRGAILQAAKAAVESNHELDRERNLLLRQAIPYSYSNEHIETYYGSVEQRSKIKDEGHFEDAPDEKTKSRNVLLNSLTKKCDVKQNGEDVESSLTKKRDVKQKGEDVESSLTKKRDGKQKGDDVESSLTKKRDVKQEGEDVESSLTKKRGVKQKGDDVESSLTKKRDVKQKGDDVERRRPSGLQFSLQSRVDFPAL